MSTNKEAVAAARKDDRIPRRVLPLLDAIRESIDAGRSIIDQHRLSHRLSRTVRWVQISARLLEQAGYLRRYRTPGAVATRYEITVPDEAAKAKAVALQWNKAPQLSPSSVAKALRDIEGRLSALEKARTKDAERSVYEDRGPRFV